MALPIIAVAAVRVVLPLVRPVVICAGKQIIKYAAKKGIKQVVRKNKLKISKKLKDFTKSTSKNSTQPKQNNITGAENLNKDKINSIFDVAKNTKNTKNKSWEVIHEGDKQVRNSQTLSTSHPAPKNNIYGHLGY